MTQLHAEASFKEVSPPLKNQQKFLVTKCKETMTY